MAVAAAHLESAQPEDDRPRSRRSHRRPFGGYRLAVAGAHVHAGAQIDGFCYVNDFAGAPPLRGEIRRMRITEAHDYDLIGALDVPSEEPLPAPPANAFQILATAR